MDSQITKIISLFMQNISYGVRKAENLKTIFSLYNRHNDHCMSTIVMNSYWLIFSLGGFIIQLFIYHAPSTCNSRD